MLAAVLLVTLLCYFANSSEVVTNHEIAMRQEFEASQVSHRYHPARPAQKEHLWIELDHKRTLIRRIAFHDARPQFHTDSLVIITLHNDRDEPSLPSLYIQLLHADGDRQSCHPLEYWKKVGNYRPVFKDYYVAYLLRFEIQRTNMPPTFVAISRDVSCSGDILPVLPVFSDIKKNKTDVFSVCTAKGLFGDIDPQWLMHWIEFNLALGATYITILIHSVKDELYNTIRPYQDEGIVEIIDWHLGVEIHEIGMWASLQECIYRNINRAEYLNLHDSDEILVPQKHLTWKEMVHDFNSVTTDASKYASFSFPNAYWFDIGLPMETAAEMTVCAGGTMKLPEYFIRTDRSLNPEYVHSKPMLRLASVITCDIHEVSECIDGYEKELKVPANFGQSFHYRRPIREEDYIQHNRRYDPNFMQPFVKPIMMNLRNRVCGK